MKHLTYQERIKIEVLYRMGRTPVQIADYLGKHYSTIYREIKRGLYDRMDSELRIFKSYSADIAQQDYDYKQTVKGAPLKIGNDHACAAFIEHCILTLHYSPAAVAAEMKRRSMKTCLCMRTIYKYIDQGLFLHVTNKHLPRRGKRKHPYNSVRRARLVRPLRRGIEERPEHVQHRDTPGHWEMDTVVGKQGTSPCLLVLTERAARLEIIRKLPDKTQLSVERALSKIAKQYGKDAFKTITSDNGSEFLDAVAIEKVFNGDCPLYYCNPQSAWQRGSNENQNILIRRFIPKGTDIGKVSVKRVQWIEDWMNNYPRKILGFRTANEVYADLTKN